MDILRKPLLTEKVTSLTDRFNRYTFMVDPKANKLQIKAAIERLFGVQVEGVNTMRYDGKLKSRNTKRGPVQGRSASYKKAIISVKKGEVIDFYGNI